MRACTFISPIAPIKIHGNFQLSDLITLLYEEALSYGVEFRLGTTVVSIDVEEAAINVDSGDVLQVDVIIGADGISGITRQILLEEEDVDEPSDHQLMWMYRSEIPHPKRI